MYDVLIKNGTIIDGNGKAMFKGDVAINDDQIVKIGDLAGEVGEKTIDAKNLFVSPGFIDISNRSDMYWQIFIDPTLECLLRQGITTIIGGNSGSSLAPIYSDDMLMSIRKWVNVQKFNVDWQSMEEFLKKVESCKLSVNFGTLVGHITLRRGLIGDELRKLSEVEVDSLKKHIEKSLKEGALGVSSGLAYIHGRAITENELVEVGKIVKKFEGLHMISTRYERNKFINAVEEIVRVVNQAEAKTHINHLKVVDKRNWEDLKKALKIIDKTNKEGKNLTFDVYPYTFGSSVLYMYLPIWATEGGQKAMLNRLKNKETYDQIARDIDKQGIDLSSAQVFNDSFGFGFENKTLGDLAKSRNKSVAETILDILLAFEGRVMILFEGTSEENLVQLMKNENAVITSNGSGYSLKNRSDLQHIIHPRSFGAFPRALGFFTREKQVLSWEETIYKFTRKPAEQLNLKKRGLIKEGFFADISIFDPNTIVDKATKENSLVDSIGIKCVLVNGKIAIEEDNFTGNRAGKVLRRR
jgi:N-acyl-D-amino-acid deacylase